jgi:hypothetical protein
MAAARAFDAVLNLAEDGRLARAAEAVMDISGAAHERNFLAARIVSEQIIADDCGRLHS